jgi:Kef-type K+ transport system membrane component KefB
VSELEFTNLLIVTVAAFGAPFALVLVAKLQVPGVVLEISVGIVIGPAVLGWVEIDTPVEVLSLIGLAFLLFLAELEIDFGRLRGRPLVVAGGGFVISFGLAVLVFPATALSILRRDGRKTAEHAQSPLAAEAGM